MVLSVVFQPLIVPSLMIFLLFYIVPGATSVPGEAKWSLLLLIMLTTFVIPFISVVGMRMTSAIQCFYMLDRKERIVPFTVIAIFYLMTSAFFYIKLNVDNLLVCTLTMITACLFLLTVITIFWKISAHVTGLSGLLAIILVLGIKFNSSDLLYPMIFSILICGAVSSARLYLNAHKPSEILGGFLLGFSFCFSIYYYLLIY